MAQYEIELATRGNQLFYIGIKPPLGPDMIRDIDYGAGFTMDTMPFQYGEHDGTTNSDSNVAYTFIGVANDRNDPSEPRRIAKNVTEVIKRAGHDVILLSDVRQLDNQERYSLFI